MWRVTENYEWNGMWGDVYKKMMKKGKYGKYEVPKLIVNLILIFQYHIFAPFMCILSFFPNNFYKFIGICV